MKSALQRHRQQYNPKIPGILAKAIDKVVVRAVEQDGDESGIDSEIAELFGRSVGNKEVCIELGNPKPSMLTVAVVLSGGQAPGGHNVIAGLYEALKRCNQSNQLLGVLGGPQGLVDNQFVHITGQTIEEYKNSGGFDMIRSGRTKLSTTEQFEKVAQNCKENGVNAIVIVGGDDSNTNAAILAEWFLQNGIQILVVGVPKTIDGDLRAKNIDISFGYDTACRTYAELVGNIARDCNSSRKYWHFVRLMGRSASHITLECAFLTHPNVALIGEEIKHNQLSLDQVAQIVVDSIVCRAESGHDFGIVLIPEGLVEFVPQVHDLINEINDLLATKKEELALIDRSTHFEWIKNNLTQNSQVFDKLPKSIAKQLLYDRDPHGNVNVSAIETEQLLIALVKTKLAELTVQGLYKGKFSCVGHFLGYEGRSAYPTNFDADYCFALGYTAYALLSNGLTGYIASIKNLSATVDQWQPMGTPLVNLMNIERRHGKSTPVIKKALVDLEGVPFAKFVASREEWAIKHEYIVPGPIQFFGPIEIVDQPPVTLLM